MTDDLRLHFQKAENYLRTAQVLVTTDYPNGAVTDSYYAFFWIVRGLLYERGVITKRHSGLRSMFNLYFINTGEIPRNYYQDLDLLFARRQLIDYEIDGQIPLSEIMDCVQMAERFLLFVQQKYA